MAISPAEVLRFLDHSLLSPTAELVQLERSCKIAADLGTASVCLLPYFVPRASELLAGTAVRVSTVVGFPHGTESLRAKLAAAEIALREGAVEIDAVVNVSLVLSGEFDRVAEEIRELTALVHGAKATGRNDDGDAAGKIKIIFENCYLSGEDKLRLCELCTEAQVDWVKTSTGFGTHGATPEDVKLMRAACPKHVQVKASGGISTLADAMQYLELGVSRIGTSRTEQIAEEIAKMTHGVGDRGHG